MINHELKLIFVHIPKTAGTSVLLTLSGKDRVERGMQDHRTLRQIDPRNNLLRMLRDPMRTQYLREHVALLTRRRPHTTRPKVNLQQYNEYYKFSIVRNPWSRAASWYNNVLRDRAHQASLGIDRFVSFEYFLKRFAGTGMLKPQLYWLRDSSGRIGVDELLRFENLPQDFNKVTRRVQIDQELRMSLQGSSVALNKLYSEKADQIIRDVYREDIEYFQYDFDDF